MKKPAPTVTTSLRLPPEVFAAVKAAADADERSVSFVVTKVLRAWMQAGLAPVQMGAAPEPAKRAIPAQASEQSGATTARQARAMGLKRFYNGRPCGNGHVTERYLNGSCVACVKADNAAKRKAAADV